MKATGRTKSELQSKCSLVVRILLWQGNVLVRVRTKSLWKSASASGDNLHSIPVAFQRKLESSSRSGLLCLSVHKQAWNRRKKSSVSEMCINVCFLDAFPDCFVGRASARENAASEVSKGCSLSGVAKHSSLASTN